MTQATQAQTPAQDPKMTATLTLLVDVEPLVGSAFKFIGRCKKCGWQTMQQDENQAKQLVMTHAEVHWPEIQALVSQGQAPETAAAAKPQSQPTAKQV